MLASDGAGKDFNQLEVSYTLFFKRHSNIRKITEKLIYGAVCTWYQPLDNNVGYLNEKAKVGMFRDRICTICARENDIPMFTVRTEN
jgi:hypothetical protein